MEDWFKRIKSDIEKRLAAETADEQLLNYVCVEVSQYWTGDVQGLVGRICEDKEVKSLTDESVFVFDKRNPAGSTITVTSFTFPDGHRSLIVVQAWLDRTCNPLAWSWPIIDIDHSLGEPELIDLREIGFLKN